MSSDPLNNTYAEFLLQQVAAEEARKASLEARGVTTLTTSGALATLLMGITTLSKTGHSLVVPHASRGWVSAALVGFVLASVAAIVANFPFFLYWADPDGLPDFVKDSWSDDASTSQMNVVDHQIK